jgi:hypothetical protein
VPDVIFETKDFKVFLDFVKAKEAVYFLEFDLNHISIQCRAKNGNFIAERRMDLITHYKRDHKPDYTCNKPLRIAFDCETKDNLRGDCRKQYGNKKATTVSFDGQRATILVKDDFIPEHVFSLPYVVPLSTEPPDRMSKILDKILQSNSISCKLRFFFMDFYKIIKTLRTAGIDLVRLRVPPNNERIEVFGSDFPIRVACYVFPTRVIQSGGQLDAYYNTIDLWHVIEAMKRHSGRYDSTLILSLIGTDGQLYFESSERRNMVDKCAILNRVNPPPEPLRGLFNRESTSPDHKFL